LDIRGITEYLARLDPSQRRAAGAFVTAFLRFSNLPPGTRTRKRTKKQVLDGVIYEISHPFVYLVGGFV
jgi:hypothetical protein